jgi:hypothetical protein
MRSRKIPEVQGTCVNLRYVMTKHTCAQLLSTDSSASEKVTLIPRDAISDIICNELKRISFQKKNNNNKRNFNAQLKMLKKKKSIYGDFCYQNPILPMNETHFYYKFEASSPFIVD